jgi:hypothetical protein
MEDYEWQSDELVSLFNRIAFSDYVGVTFSYVEKKKYETHVDAMGNTTRSGKANKNIQVVYTFKQGSPTAKMIKAHSRLEGKANIFSLTVKDPGSLDQLFFATHCYVDENIDAERKVELGEVSISIMAIKPIQNLV